MNFLKQMSMPNHLSVSPKVVSEHFRRNHAGAMERPNSADPTQILTRDRLGSDPGRGLVSASTAAASTSQPPSKFHKKVLSGLSLALMNEETNQKNGTATQSQPQPQQQHQQQQPQQSDATTGVPGGLGATPPSPLIQPSGSGDINATLRQRMAFHHPPPSFDDQSIPNSYSISPNTNANGNIPTSGPPAHVAQYGYGYNNGHHAIPPSSNAVNVGFLGPSRNNSPSPMPVNTPPQPMFIGSQALSFGMGGGMQKLSGGGESMGAKSRQGGEEDVPFRNPTSLQQAPTDDPGISSSGFSSKLASVQASFQMQSLSNHAPSAQVQQVQVQTKDTILPPLNTLDALNSSPFKMSQSMAPDSMGPPLSSSPGGVSMFSSMVMGKGSAAFGHLDDGFPLALTSTSATSSAVIPSRSNSEHISRSGGAFQTEKEDDYEDMPFAVDLDYSSHVSVSGAGPGTATPKTFTKSGAGDFGMSSHNSMSSQVVTSLAHRCSTAGRLKLFNNNEESMHTNSVALEKSFVEDQLNEFRSFGDSITASGLLPPMKR